MPTPHLILIGLILPSIIVGLVTLIGSWISKGHPWPGIVAVGGGIFIAFRGITDQWPLFPPLEAPARIVWFAAGLSLIAVVASLRHVPWPVRMILSIAAPLGIGWYVFKPIPAVSLPAGQMWEMVAAAAGITFLISNSTEQISRRRSAAAAALALGPMAAGAGALLLLLGTLTLGWLAASIALMVLGWFLAGLLNRFVTLSRGPIYFVVTILAGLLLYDYFSADGSITLVEIGLLAVAPLLAWVVELPGMRDWKSWKRELLRVILVAIPVAGAVTLAVIQLKKDSHNGLEM